MFAELVNSRLVVWKKDIHNSEQLAASCMPQPVTFTLTAMNIG
jgi:hypothetical protein